MIHSLAALHLDINNPWLLGALESAVILWALFTLIVIGDKVFLELFRRALQGFQKAPDERLLKGIHGLFKRILILVAADLIVFSFPLPQTISQWTENVVFVAITILILLTAFDMTNVLGRVLRTRAREFEPLVTKILKLVAATIALMIVMRHFNYDIWHIMTALGVGTLAVGLAAQPTLTNMIAGFTILVDRPFRPGDRVTLSGGDTGEVLEIGMRATRFLTPDGNLLVVSNSDLVNTRLTNFSQPDTNVSAKVKFYVSHDAPLEEIKNSLRNAIQNKPHIVGNSVQVLSTGLTDWGIEMAVFFSAEHFTKTGNLNDQIIDVIIAEMKKRGLKFAVNPAALPK